MRSWAKQGRFGGADRARRLAARILVAAMATGCAESKVASSQPTAQSDSDSVAADEISADSPGQADTPPSADAGLIADAAAGADAELAVLADAEVEPDPEVAAPADVSTATDAASPVDISELADISEGADIAAEGDVSADADAALNPEVLTDAAISADLDAPSDAALSIDTDGAALPEQPTAVAWSGGFVNQAPYLSFLLSLPLGSPKPVAPMEWAPLSLGLLDDLNGDGAADLVVANQAGALAVAHGPLSAATKLKTVATAGKAAIHSLAVLHRHGQPPLVLTGSAPIGVWQAQGDQWLQVGTSTGLNLPGNGLRHGLTVTDLDSDGLLDVLVSDFNCEKPGGHQFLLDRGDGVFSPSPDLEFEGLGAQWAAVTGDWDGDGDLDVAWLHDGCGNPKTTQGFFRQLPRGPDGWPVYQRQMPHSLFAFPQAPVPYASPMGGATLDVFNTGKAGLALANTGLQMPIETAKAFLLGVDEADLFNVQNNLLLGQADGSLVDVAGAAGLKSLPDPQQGLDMQAWAVLPLDVNGDGWQDLLVAHAAEPNGNGFGIPGPTRPVLLLNQGFGKFAEISQKVGLPSPVTAPVLTTGDIDGDGDTDALLGRTGEPLMLLTNQFISNGKRLRLRLRGHTSNPAAIGARVTAQTAVGPVTRWVGLDAPYATHADPQVELGIGATAAAKVEIAWPSGYVQQLGMLPAGSVLLVDEPPLLQLSARRVQQGGEIEVAITPRDSAGGLLAVAATATLVQNTSAFSWKKPLTCAAMGCSGVLVAAAVASPGTAFLQVSWPGTQLKVWPRLTAVP